VDLSAYLALLKRWSLTLLASALVGGGVAYFVASRVPPTYAAEARAIVGPINTDENTLGAAQQLAQTYAELVTTDRILSVVIEDVGLDVGPAVLRETTRATADSTTRILAIEVQAGNPDAAATIADAFMAALGELVASEQVRPEGEIAVLTAAVANPQPVAPQVSLIVMLAAVAGLIAATALVMLIDYFSNTASGGDDLVGLTQAPFLGTLAPRRRFRPSSTKPLVVEAEPNSRVALAYRLMGSRIFSSSPEEIKSLVVFGAEGQEGSGEVAANLAAVLTRAGRAVRLVDANDEDREVSHLFDIDPTYGLGELARGNNELLQQMINRRPPGLDVIPRLAGADPRLLDEDRIGQVLQRLSSGVDLVILSTAPIHGSASALLWARSADGAILVVRRDRTKRENISFSVEILRMLGTRLIGTVFHTAPHRAPPRPSAGADSAGRATTRRGRMRRVPEQATTDAAAARAKGSVE